MKSNQNREPLKAKEIFENISSWETHNQSMFLERFLRDLTVMNRAILDSHNLTVLEKNDCLKWSNELSHRVWNLHIKLGNQEGDVIKRFDENIRFYASKCHALKGHLGATLKSTYEVCATILNL